MSRPFGRCVRGGGYLSEEEWALAASVVFAGLWSGLLATLTLIQPMLRSETGRDFENFMPPPQLDPGDVHVGGVRAVLGALLSLGRRSALEVVSDG
jgi:hypothetical protein